MLNCTVRTQKIGQLIKQPFADVRVGHFAAPEKNRQLDFVAAVKKLRCLPTFRLQVVIVDLGANSHFFEFNHMLISPRLPLFTALLVAKLPIVHQAADRGNRVRCDLYQVESSLAGHLERISCLNNPDLRALIIDESDLANPDALIHASLHWSGYGSPP